MGLAHAVYLLEYLFISHLDLSYFFLWPSKCQFSLVPNKENCHINEFRINISVFEVKRHHQSSNMHLDYFTYRELILYELGILYFRKHVSEQKYEKLTGNFWGITHN